MVKLRAIVRITIATVLLMNICGTALAGVTLQEQRDLVNVTKIAECNPDFWHTGVISNSANFECENTFVNWHIVDHDNIKIRYQNGSVITETFYELAAEDYVTYLFESTNEQFTNDGSLINNVDVVQYDYLRGKQL